MAVTTFATYTVDNIYAAVPEFIKLQDVANAVPPYDLPSSPVVYKLDSVVGAATAGNDTIKIFGINLLQTPIALYINQEIVIADGADFIGDNLQKVHLRSQLQHNHAANTPVFPFYGPLYNYINSMGALLDQQVNIISRDAVGKGQDGGGADGTVDTKNYGSASGWSQVLDIDRCPDYALPWLAQFVGIYIPQISTLSRADKVSKIKERSSFKRGTSPAMVNALVAVVNSNNPPVLMQASDVIVMENTAYSSGSYVSDDNSLTILMPLRFLLQENYQHFLDNYSPYSRLQSSFAEYINMSFSATPTTDSGFHSYIYRFRPAGVKIFIGGY